MFTRQWLADVVERVLATFVAAFAAALILAGANLMSLGALKSAALAGLAATLSLIKGLVASRIGDPTSASLVRSGRPSRRYRRRGTPGNGASHATKAAKAVKAARAPSKAPASRRT